MTGVAAPTEVKTACNPTGGLRTLCQTSSQPLTGISLHTILLADVYFGRQQPLTNACMPTPPHVSPRTQLALDMSLGNAGLRSRQRQGTDSSTLLNGYAGKETQHDA